MGALLCNMACNAATYSSSVSLQPRTRKPGTAAGNWSAGMKKQRTKETKGPFRTNSEQRAFAFVLTGVSPRTWLAWAGNKREPTSALCRSVCVLYCVGAVYVLAVLSFLVEQTLGHNSKKVEEKARRLASAVSRSPALCVGVPVLSLATGWCSAAIRSDGIAL